MLTATTVAVGGWLLLCQKLAAVVPGGLSTEAFLCIATRQLPTAIVSNPLFLKQLDCPGFNCESSELSLATDRLLIGSSVGSSSAAQTLQERGCWQQMRS